MRPQRKVSALVVTGAAQTTYKSAVADPDVVLIATRVYSRVAT